MGYVQLGISLPIRFLDEEYRSNLLKGRGKRVACSYGLSFFEVFSSFSIYNKFVIQGSIDRENILLGFSVSCTC